MGFHHITAVCRKGGLDFECPHQATQHLHRQHRGTPSRWVRENALWQSCRSLGLQGGPRAHCAAPDFGEADGLTQQRKQLRAAAARNPGQAAAGAARGWDIVHGRPSLPGAAERGSMQGDWNSLFTFSTSVFWAKCSFLMERSKGELGKKHLPRNFSEQGCSNFSEQRVLCC